MVEIGRKRSTKKRINFLVVAIDWLIEWLINKWFYYPIIIKWWNEFLSRLLLVYNIHLKCTYLFDSHIQLVVHKFHHFSLLSNKIILNHGSVNLTNDRMNWQRSSHSILNLYIFRVNENKISTSEIWVYFVKKIICPTPRFCECRLSEEEI